jgi:hypothetical protein
MNMIETNISDRVNQESSGALRANAFKNQTRILNHKEEITMTQNANSKLWKGLGRLAVAIVAIGVAATGSAVNAKPNSNKTADMPANVVAHIQISGGPVTRMLLVKKNGKEYLLLGLDSPTSVAIFDVSSPGQPQAINTTPGAAGASSVEVKLIADTLALFGTSDAVTASLSNAKEIRDLTGVTASMKDKVRGLIYVTNGDGLWVVKTKQKADADAMVDNYGS